MTDKEILAIFQDALDLLNDRPNFALRRDRSRTSYKLAARMDACLRILKAPPHPAIREARERWASTSFLRIDPQERVIEPDSEGVWVRGWILVEHASLGHIRSELRARYERTLATLAEETRRVFLAHSQEGLHYGAIAERFGMTVPDVQEHVASALAALAAAIDAG